MTKIEEVANSKRGETGVHCFYLSGGTHDTHTRQQHMQANEKLSHHPKKKTWEEQKE